MEDFAKHLRLIHFILLIFCGAILASIVRDIDPINQRTLDELNQIKNFINENKSGTIWVQNIIASQEKYNPIQYTLKVDEKSLQNFLHSLRQKNPGFYTDKQINITKESIEKRINKKNKFFLDILPLIIKDTKEALNENYYDAKISTLSDFQLFWEYVENGNHINYINFPDNYAYITKLFEQIPQIKLIISSSGIRPNVLFKDPLPDIIKKHSNITPSKYVTKRNYDINNIEQRLTRRLRNEYNVEEYGLEKIYLFEHLIDKNKKYKNIIRLNYVELSYSEKFLSDLNNKMTDDKHMSSEDVISFDLYEKNINFVESFIRLIDTTKLYVLISSDKSPLKQGNKLANDKSFNFSHWENFQKSFPFLSRLKENSEHVFYEKINDLHKIMPSVLKTNTRTIEFSGIKITQDMISRWGTLIIIILQLYFCLHMYEFSRRNIYYQSPPLIPWIALYDVDGIKIIYILSIYILPSCTIIIIYLNSYSFSIESILQPITYLKFDLYTRCIINTSIIVSLFTKWPVYKQYPLRRLFEGTLRQLKSIGRIIVKLLQPLVNKIKTTFGV